MRLFIPLEHFGSKELQIEIRTCKFMALCDFISVIHVVNIMSKGLQQDKTLYEKKSIYSLQRSFHENKLGMKTSKSKLIFLDLQRYEQNDQQ